MGVASRIRRCALVAVVAAAAAVAVVGCGGSGGGGITLTFIAHDFPPRDAWDKKQIAAYERLHPKVHIKELIIPYPAFTDKLKTALASNSVDIFADETPLGPYFASGAVAPVDWRAMGFNSLAAFEAKYIPGGLTPFSYNGVPYASPNEATSYALYINTKILRSAGIDPATQYPKTWEDVLALSQRLVKRDSQGRLVQRGFDFGYPATNNDISPDDEYFPFIAQKGGQILSPDGKTSVFNSAGTVAAYEFISDWVHKYKLGGPPAPDATQSFLKGRVAMIVIGPWFEPQVRTSAPEVWKNLMVVPFPVFKGAVGPYGPQLDGYGHMVNAHISKAKQRAAWQFIAFLDRLHGDPIPYVQQTGIIIPRVEVSAEPGRVAGAFKDYQVFADALKRPQLGLYDSLKAPQISTAIDDAVDRVATKGQSPAQAVAQASKEIQAALNSP